MKKIITTLLILCLLVSLFTGISFAGETNYSYEIVDNELIISGEGEIPTQSFYNWADNKATIQKITINEGITSIGNEAFKMFSSLTEVSLPTTLTAIGKYVFQSCSNLKTIDLPDNLQSIGNGCFYATGLTEIVIPNTVEELGKKAFYSCTNLTSATLSTSLNTIKEETFSTCISLTAIKVPENITVIEAKAFYNNYKLEDITLPAGLQSIGNDAFFQCYELDDIYFEGSASDLKKLDLGNNDIKDLIQVEAAEDIVCSGICNDAGTVIYKLDTTGTLTFSGSGYMNNFDYYTLPEYMDYKNQITKVVVEDGIYNIGEFAFINCTAIQELVCGDSVTTIGRYAFYQCTGLTTVTLNNVNYIDAYAFYGDKLLDGSDFNGITVESSAIEFEGDELKAFDKSLSLLNTSIDYLNSKYLTTDLGLAIDYTSPEDEIVLTTLLNKIIKDCTTDEEKCLAIYNWVHTNISYGDETSSALPVDVIKTEKGLCAGQAQLISTFFKLAGVPTTVVRGMKCGTTYINLNKRYTIYGKYSHEWVMAYYNNDWYVYDSVWDFKNLNDRTKIASVYFIEHIDGIVPYDKNAVDLLKAPYSNPQIYYMDGTYKLLENGGNNKVSGGRTLSMGGYKTYTFGRDKKFGNQFYLDNTLPYENTFINNVYKSHFGVYTVSDDFKYHQMTKNGILVFEGDTLNLVETTQSSNSSVVEISNNKAVAKSTGKAELTASGSVINGIIIYVESLANTNETIQANCSHNHTFEYNEKQYCSYCGLEIEVVETNNEEVKEETKEEAVEEVVDTTNKVTEEVVEEVKETTPTDVVVEETKEEVKEETPAVVEEVKPVVVISTPKQETKSSSSRRSSSRSYSTPIYVPQVIVPAYTAIAAKIEEAAKTIVEELKVEETKEVTPTDVIAEEVKEEETPVAIEKTREEKLVEAVKATSIKISTAKVKKGIKVTVNAVSNLEELEELGYTVKYKFNRYKDKACTKNDLTFITSKNVYTNTKVTRGQRYYYKVTMLVYNENNEEVEETEITQSSTGIRKF